MIGYILGYSYGDGYFNKYSVVIDSKDKEGLQRIVNYIQKLYNRKLKIRLTKLVYYRLRIPYDIYNSLKNRDLTFKKINRNIPKWYYGFLAGFYDAEGNCQYQNHNWYIRLGSTDKKLFNFVVLLLKYFNLSIITRKCKQYKHYKVFYEIKLLTKETFNFFLQIRPAIKRKYPDLKILSNGTKIKQIIKVKHKYNKYFKNYNLTVEPNNNYFIKGILVHNCFKGGKEGGKISALKWEKRLNGKIIYIKGNHDKRNSVKTIIERLVIKYENKRINLVHRPEFADVNYEINFTGHVHKNWKIERIRKGFQFTNCINVGIDVWDFYPVTYEEIMKRYSHWKKNLKLKYE